MNLWRQFGATEFIYAAPQAPYPFLKGDEIGFSWATGSHKAPHITARAKELSIDYIARATEEVSKHYKVGDVYLMGFSQGGTYTYNAGIRNPYLFKGLICFAGWLDTEWVTLQSIAAAKNLRVFIGHGIRDQVVRYQNAIEARNTLEKYGYDVTFYSSDGGHIVTEKAVGEVLEWIESTGD
jgi:phospholipase/carboxylesterase